jgi:hypothetical protein
LVRASGTPTGPAINCSSRRGYRQDLLLIRERYDPSPRLKKRSGLQIRCSLNEKAMYLFWAMNAANDDHIPEPAGTEVPGVTRVLCDGDETAIPEDLTNLVKLLARQTARDMFSAVTGAESERTPRLVNGPKDRRSEALGSMLGEIQPINISSMKLRLVLQRQPGSLAIPLGCASSRTPEPANECPASTRPTNG